MSAVLIVDDQDDLRFTLSKIVEKQGYSVTTAASGADALDVLRSSVIDMVFLDI